MSLRQPEVMITPDIIDGILNCSDFTEQVHQVASHTATKDTEAGFGVYALPEGTFAVSDVVEGTATYDIEADSDHHTVDLAPVIWDSKEQIRDDLVLTLHSHPEGRHMPPEEAMQDDETYADFYYRRGKFAHFHKIELFPSDGDTSLYAKIAERNLGHVGVILSTDTAASLAGLLFYRHNLSTPPVLSPYDEQWNPSKSLMHQRMAEQGFKFIETDFSFDSGKYSVASEEVVRALF